MKLRILFLTLFCCQSGFAQTTFPTFKAFQNHLNSLSENATQLDAFYNELTSAKKVPFAMGDSVAFLYRGTANSVGFAGDFNGWSPTNATRLGTSNVWQWVQKFPTNARLDYKIVLNGNNWILDPINTNQQMSGFGANSELRMPSWVFPQVTVRASGIAQGSLGGNQLISSTKLGYQLQYRVYTPPNYDNLNNLPVVYVTDGQEYSADALGAMLPVTDNLINGFNGKKIKPVILVFIDPRNPSSLGTNRRQQEYTTNPNYADFVAQELVPVIDAAYKTDKTPQSRMILGTSLGGLVSAYIGFRHSAIFGNVAPMSPAFWYSTSIFTMYEGSAKLPLKWFMTTGTIRDTQDRALQMKAILDTKGYPLQYIEVLEGHSWGNWRALIDDILTAAFPISEAENPEAHDVFEAFPNPATDSLSVKFSLPDAQTVDLRLFDVLGREVRTVLSQNLLSAGEHEIPIYIKDLAAGNYFLHLKSQSMEQKRTVVKVMR
jgi:enterochelin esterase-like enzyme